jgi:ankyrin repeat protein
VRWVLFEHPDVQVNYRAGGRNTPLDVAARRGDTECVKLLLQHPVEAAPWLDG